MVDYGEVIRGHFKNNNKFRSFGERYSSLKDKEEQLLFTGISAIDECVCGFMKNELILIGADSGIGKTEIGIIIAEHVAKMDMKVVLFSLESYDGEIEDRRKFSAILQETYGKLTEPIQFKKWVCGKYKDILQYEKNIKTDKKLENNLFIRYRKDDEDYTISQFEADMEEITQDKKIDLVILDHLHFFSMDEDKNENKQITKIIRKIRDIALIKNIPIIVLAQLRKNKGSDSIVPDYTEFYGSSEIFKSATTIITMAPDYEAEASEYKYPTLFRICKDRFGSVANRYALGCMYDAKYRDYDSRYRLYKLKKNATKKEFISGAKKPFWACSAYSTESGL
jgi:replicative DNA helicase